MILVTIGTNDVPYDRLFEMMDHYSAVTGEDVVMQTAYSGFRGAHTECFAFKPDEEFSKYYDRADVIVCHAGIGTIVNGLERNIPLVLVPRDVVMSGAEQDQQMQIARKVVSTGRGVCVSDLSQLYEKISEAGALVLEPYVKDTGLLDYIDSRLIQISSKCRR